MMIIRLTQKLAKKIKVAPTAALPRNPNPFADWIADLFTVRRMQYLILVNTATHYSVIFPGRGVTNAEAFLNHAFTALARQMHSDGQYPVFKQRIIPLSAEITFSKTGDRRLTALMNDNVRSIKAHLERLGATPGATSPGHDTTPTDANVKVIPFPGDQWGGRT